MNGLTEVSNLNKYIIEPIRNNLGKKLETFRYYDVCKEDELMTNNKGIDIISHQLELKFESSPPVFISWATVDGWHQYSLCASETSFCTGAQTFTKKDNNWANIIGNPLKRFKIYGYRRNVIASTETATGGTSKDTYYNEPHLLILHFENEMNFGVANFYFEKDFIPKYPMGDDVWIIYGNEDIDSYVAAFSFEMLVSENCKQEEVKSKSCFDRPN